MSYRDREVLLIGQLLQHLLPQPGFRPIGATTICGNEHFLLVRIELFPIASPPPSDTLHCKLGGLMINAHIDKSALVHHVVDSIGHRFAISQDRKSTRLNSSHASISYAVFCLKK